MKRILLTIALLASTSAAFAQDRGPSVSPHRVAK